MHMFAFNLIDAIRKSSLKNAIYIFKAIHSSHK